MSLVRRLRRAAAHRDGSSAERELDRLRRAGRVVDRVIPWEAFGLTPEQARDAYAVGERIDLGDLDHAE